MSAPLLEPESGYPCAAIGPIEIRIVSQTDIIIISALIAQLQEQREKAPPEEVVPQFDSSGDSTTTKSESPTPKPAPPPDIPNGGLQAWCQVAGSFFLFFNGPGIVSTFGAFQTYYELNHLSHKSASQISWIGSTQAFLLLLVGVLTGPLYDWGYFRTLIFAGCFLEVFGMMMVSICREYWQAVLAQALLVGVGCGCTFIPSVAILPSYFSTKKGLANGIAASGSGFGSVIYPIIFQRLEHNIGFGWATRVIALVMLATFMVPLAVMKMRSKPPAVRKMFDASAWKEAPYTLWTLSSVIGFLGLFTPIFYGGSFAIQENVMSVDKAFYLGPILNAGSIFGRILPNFLVDKTGPLNLYIPCSLIAAILGFSWIAVDNVAGVVVFNVLYGFVSGLYLTLPAVAVISFSPNLGVVGARMGMAFSVSALGLLVGTPIAGAIVNHGWVGLQAYTGASFMLATVIMIAARVSKAGFGVAVKA